MKIDLHVHSTHSDGKDELPTVYADAADANLAVMAITDHDTVNGWVHAAELAQQYRIGLIRGIEVSTSTTAETENGTREISVHMLAYLPDPNRGELLQRVTEVKVARETRLEVFVKNLQAKYPELTMDAIRAAQKEKESTFGRPDIADALIKLGVYQSRDEAFEHDLHKNSPFYVPNIGLDTEAAVRMIRAAGGVPIMAHPMARSKRESANSGDAAQSEAAPRIFPRAHFEQLVDAGLAGFEVHHREVPEPVRDWLLKFVAEHNLIATGSSDYHGMTGKPNRLGENLTSEAALQAIIAQATGIEPILF